MKKMLLLSFILVISCIVIISCSNLNESNISFQMRENATTINSGNLFTPVKYNDEIDMILQSLELSVPKEKKELYIGDIIETIYFVSKYNYDLYHFGDILYYIVDSEAYNDWSYQFEHVKLDGRRPSWQHNFVTIIKEFNIPESKCYEVMDKYPDNSWCFTKEQISAIYHGDKYDFDEAFKNPRALFSDGKIYSPEWLLTHTVEDYKAEGIPLDSVSRCVEQWEKDKVFTQKSDQIEAVKSALRSAQ